MCGRKHKTLSLKERLQLINDATTLSKSELCTKYQCSLVTVNRILRNQNEVQQKSKCVNLNTKRQRGGANEKVEKALKIWFDQIRNAGGIVSTTMIMEKAQQLAVTLNENFNPSAGWLWRWQKREGAKVRKLHGEGGSADTEAGENYKEVIKHIISKFGARDIFNADESGIFYKALPSSTLSRSNTELRGTKQSKERLTFLFICNATGDYKKCYVIGKSKNPRCFKNNIIPVKYFANTKVWMTGQLWVDIMDNLNEEMKKLNRKIVLFVDNAAVHKNAGVFHDHEQTNFIDDEDIDPALIIDDTFSTEYEEFINFDNNEQCYGLLSDAEIAQEVLNDSSDEDDEVVCLQRDIPIKDLLNGIELLREHFQSKNKFCQELEHMQADIIFHKIENKHQKRITDFFEDNNEN